MSDSEYEEEEILVFADFNNQLLPDELGDINTSLKLIGLDTENPIAEVNGSLFKGSYDFAMGTNLFFEKDDAPRTNDTLFEPSCKQMYKFFAKTNKVLNFQRMFVEANTDDKLETAETSIDDDKPTTSAAAAAAERMAENAAISCLRTSLTYEEAIKKFPTASEIKRSVNKDS